MRAAFLRAYSRDLAELHARMPVVIELADWPLWLGETEGDSRTRHQKTLKRVIAAYVSMSLNTHGKESTNAG